MVRFEGSNMTITYAIDMEENMNPFAMRWYDAGDELPSHVDSVVVLIPERKSIFRLPRDITCVFASDVEYIVPDTWKALAIVGVEKAENTRFTFTPHDRGSRRDGTARTVYEYVDMYSCLPIRMGLTVHETLGSWSSWPPHEFEAEALRAPLPLFAEFYEEFAFVTQPAGMWGLQLRRDGRRSNNHDYESMINVVRDLSITSVALGSHPVVAGPGTKMAYFWCYSAIEGWEKFPETTTSVQTYKVP